MCLHAHIEKNHYLKNNSMSFLYTSTLETSFLPTLM